MSLEEFRAEIAWRLSLYRPDRYRVDDLDWAKPVMTWAEATLAADPMLLRTVVDEDTRS